MKMDIRYFDVQAYLDDRGVRVKESGKNVSEGWISMECPWCDDTSNHLGIHLEKKWVSCWKCGGKHITQLVKQIEGSWHVDPDTIISQFVLPDAPLKTTVVPYSEMLEYPREAVPLYDNPGAMDYLESRHFNPRQIEQEYRVKAVHNLGNYRWRIIIPIIMGGRIGGFTSRDYTNRQALRYKNQPKGQSPIPQDKWIYNIDTVRGKAILVEGPFDVWRLGEGAISFLGIVPSHKQIAALEGLEKIYVLFDMEEQAQERAEEVGAKLTSVALNVENITVDKEGDPADLTPEEATQLKRELEV